MRPRRILVLFGVSSFLCASLAFSQDSQSLADAARQSRQQKMKDTQAAPKVITNDEIPEHVGPTETTSYSSHVALGSSPEFGSRKMSADQWKSQIQAQKNAIASLQREIANFSASIHFPVACLKNCPQRNERQLQKENRVEVLKAQLDQQQKHLEDLQESARKQGFGSSVYDP